MYVWGSICVCVRARICVCVCVCVCVWTKNDLSITSKGLVYHKQFHVFFEKKNALSSWMFHQLLFPFIVTIWNIIIKVNYWGLTFFKNSHTDARVRTHIYFNSHNWFSVWCCLTGNHFTMPASYFFLRRLYYCNIIVILLSCYFKKTLCKIRHFY